MPEAIINTVYQKVSKVLKDPESVKRLDDLGLFVVANPPNDFGIFVRDEIAEWAELIRKMGL